MTPIPLYGIEAFAQAARTHPQRTALVCGGRSRTYAQLAARVGGIAAYLQGLALPAPARVGVFTADTPDTYASLLACHAAGAAYVPVNHKFPVARQAAVVHEAGLTHLLADPTDPADPALDALRQACPGLHLVPTATLPDAPLPPVPAFHADRLAYLLFTSGSTGRPKGVPLTQGNLAHFLGIVCHPDVPYDFGPDDRFLQMFDLTFDLSVFSFFVPMALGAACCTVPEGGIGAFAILDTLDTQACTVALMVPSALAYLKPYFDEIELPALRWSLFCGEALPADLAAAWQARISHAALENVYGPTEATIFCTRYRWHADSPAEAHLGVVPIGQPWAGVDIQLLDDTGHPHATEGELCLGGPQVTPGYWHNPEKNAEAFVQLHGQRWYRTGDRCRRTPAGHLLYLGRTDAQVKVDGYRVELGEIEHHVRRLTGLAQVAVVAVPGAGGTTVLHLWLAGFAGSTAHLQAALAEVLPAYMQPRTIHRTDALPLNANGKTDRPRLRDWSAQSADA